MTDFIQSPYYDDFKQNALDNNYMRILFKPGYAVQARELTQIQSILQNQIKQFGDHIFQNGSPVIGGNMTLDNKVTYLKLLPQYNNVDIDIDAFKDIVVRNENGTIQAKVLATYYPADGIPTLLVRYLTGNVFADGSTLKIQGTSTYAQLQASNSTGQGTVVSINDGVFYADGYFIQVAQQSIVASPYDTSANVKVGLEISDDFVTSDVDTTLLDPAQGSFNYQAPGADRYQVNLSLSTRPLDTVVDESKFFELMRIENGAITKQVKYPIYAELEKTLARRTFDESGDYTVRPFRASIFDGADANNYVVAVEPGKAYVKGFEFETLGTMKMEVPKPRSAADIKTLVDTDVDISYGNYVYVTSLRGGSNGFINIAALEKVDIHCVDTPNVIAGGSHSGTANAFFYSNTKIGTARVRNFIRSAADTFTTNSGKLDSLGVYGIYLTDLDIQPLTLKVTAASSNANTIRLQDKVSANDNAYVNVSLTVLPIRLDAVGNVANANVFINGFRVNANSTTANVFNSPNLNVGDIVNVGGMVRKVLSINTGGDYFMVNTAFTKTIDATGPSNPLQVFVQTDYSQNVGGQTRTIVRYDGASRTAFLDRNFDNGGVPDSNTVISLNFHADHIESLVSGEVVSNVRRTAVNTSMNVASQSRNILGEVDISDRLRAGLIKKLPGSYIKRSSLSNADYNHNKILLNQSLTSNQITLTQSSGLETYETIPFADATGPIRDSLIVIVRDNNGNTSYPNGSILQLTSANVTIGSPATSITIDTYVPDILKVDILLKVKENDAETKIRIKNLISNTSFSATSSSYTYPTAVNGNTTVTLPGYGAVANINVSHGLIFLTDTTHNSIQPGDTISLYVPDVVRVRKVLKGNTTNLPDINNFEDITESFAFDYGQRDEMYDHASLTLKEGYDVVNAKLLVHVDFYQHVYTTSNSSFFCVDSYPLDQYNSGQIPSYITETGEKLRLADCLDFRPSRVLGDGSLGFSNGKIPSPEEITELTLQYYLPRIDKLVLSKDKEFRVVQGKSSPQPIAPDDLDDAMTLYTIKLPPYVADVREIKMKYKDNRGYTMKDIASLDKRLKKVEYFTSLNNVENLALADPTQYEDGTKKEKYGIVGENFKNFNIADFKSQDFRVSLNNGFMLPSISSYPVGMRNITNDGTRINKKTISLNYTETPVVVQDLCADKVISVQPFLFGQFNGTISLTPETDYWCSEVLKPEIISVPERIIEHNTVIRETVREPSPPPYVPPTSYPPRVNAAPVIITTPNTNPPAPRANDNVVLPPSNTVPIIPPIIVDPTPLSAYPQDWPGPLYCPAPEMRVHLADGTMIPAGELEVGMLVQTQHEDTLKWGNFAITHVTRISNSERVKVKFDNVEFVCSLSHKFYKDGNWVAASDLKVGDRVDSIPPQVAIVRGIEPHSEGDVMRITVDEAHTYYCEGLFSHNKEPAWEPFILPDFNDYGPVYPPPPPQDPVIPPPTDQPFDWLSLMQNPPTPITFGGFDGTTWFATAPIFWDLPPAPPLDFSAADSYDILPSNPLVLGTNPLDSINYDQPIISTTDVARDDTIYYSGGGNFGDFDMRIFEL